SKKYIRGGPNVILTKKTKPGFLVEIDEKFLIREVSEQSEQFQKEIINKEKKSILSESLKVVDLVEQ
ncbi:13892_t:CDS:2, partial [Racocetra persica]